MSNKTILATAVGSAFIASMAAAPLASAADNPFAMQALNTGYKVAQAATTPEAKCGQGKCGNMKMKAAADQDKPGAAGMPCRGGMDANNDGTISKEEFVKGHEAMFDAMDTNKDGVLDASEMGKMRGGQCGGAKKPMQGQCGAKK
jgi:uncharacterized low-complexity protein